MLRWVALAFALLLAVGALGWLAATLWEPTDAPGADEVLMRRDPIRELARELEERVGAAAPAAAPEAGEAPPAAPAPAP